VLAVVNRMQNIDPEDGTGRSRDSGQRRSGPEGGRCRQSTGRTQ